MNNYREFFKYVIPSVLAFALSGVYGVVDGYFIGNNVGDLGLSTINIAAPISSLILAVGTGIGTGGAVIYAIRQANNNTQKATDFLKGTIVILFTVGIFLSVLLFVSINPLLKFLGAEGDIFLMGREYLKVIALGGILQILGVGILPIIRNNGSATYAMVTMALGFITNIILDYIFIKVLGIGLNGAALATVIGQGVSAVLSIFYLISKKISFLGIPKSILSIFKEVFKIGIAPFGITMSPMVSIVLMNRALIKNGGSQAVATYACISYITVIVALLLQGIGDGSQPLMSKYYGKGETKNLKNVRFLAYISSSILAIVCSIFLFINRSIIGIAFGASELVVDYVSSVLPIFLIGIIFLAFSRVTSSGFYAVENTFFSYILVYVEPILIFLLLLILPRFYGERGVWWSMVTAQILTSSIAFILKIFDDKRNLVEHSKL